MIHYAAAMIGGGFLGASVAGWWGALIGLVLGWFIAGTITYDPPRGPDGL